MRRPINDKMQAPFMEVEKGFGFQGTLLYDDIEDKIQCHECGEWLTSLSHSHLTKHRLSARAYKEKYELNYSTALCIPSISEGRSESSEFKHKLLFETIGEEEMKKHLQKMAKRGALERRRRKNFRLTVEMMNRYGTCPKQLEERFIQIIERLGHTPTFDELRKEDASLLSVLYRRFKNYTNALAYFGLKSKKKVNIKSYGMKNIKLAIQKWVDDNKRLPNPRDTKVGFLPDYMTIQKYFGNWKKARKFAFNYLKKNYPVAAESYDINLRRLSVHIPGGNVRRLAE